MVRRSLAKAASWSAITPRRDNGRTRHSPTAHKRGSGGCSRVYFPACHLPLSPNRGLSGRDADWYFSLSSQFPIGLDYSTGEDICQAGNLQPACRKSLFDTLQNFLKLQKSFKKLFDPTRKGTLTVHLRAKRRRFAAVALRNALRGSLSHYPSLRILRREVFSTASCSYCWEVFCL